VINQTIRQAGPIDVHVIFTESRPGARGPAQEPRLRPVTPRSSRAVTAAWLTAVLVIPTLVIALLPFKEAVGVPGALLVLLLAPVCVALLGGLVPALTASAVAFVLADWFYIEPTHSLRTTHAGDFLALIVFVAVSSLVSGLVDRLARRSAQLARGQVETEALAELASGTALLDREALHRLVTELRVALGLDAVAVLAPTADGWRVDASAGEPVPTAPVGASYSAELASGSMLVVSGPSLAAEDRRLLAAFVAQLRLAQSTLRLQADALEAAGLAEANRVREALLAAVSHDLRGPLANIKAAASSLLSDDVEWPADIVRSFSETIDIEADRLHAVITNLLDMGRLQAGMLGVAIEPVSMDDVVAAALASLSVDVSTVDVDVPEDLPLASADAALLERAVANVVLNALNWSPNGSRVRIEAGAVGDDIHLRVVDRGAGIPRDQRDAVFQPFQRLGDGGRASYDGIGLGLAVTKGFIDAMGGEVLIDDTPGGGATVVITLGVAS
jgi:two-component system sensor histidine kinase KdpD